MVSEKNKNKSSTSDSNGFIYSIAKFFIQEAAKLQKPSIAFINLEIERGKKNMQDLPPIFIFSKKSLVNFIIIYKETATH